MPRTARPVRLKDKWRVRYLDHEGTRCSAVFTSYKEADHELRLRQAEVEQVKRGELDAPPPVGKTVGDAIDYFEEHRSPRKRSCSHDKSIFRAHLRPAFASVRLCEFGIAHVDKFVAKQSHLNPKTVNNLLTILITVLGVAHELGWIRKVPRIRKPRVSVAGVDYLYLRTPADVAAFLRSAHEENAVGSLPQP